MSVLRNLLVTILCLVALVTPSVASGLCAFGIETHVAISDSTGHRPTPCEMQGGKRIRTESPQLVELRRIPLLRAVAQLWAGGLDDDHLSPGVVPGTEPPPPRLG